MKKNIYKILFAIVCMFMTVGLIVADDTVVGTGQGQTDDGGANTSSEDFRLTNNNGGGRFIFGIRMSFHTSDGTKIASKDYVMNRIIDAPEAKYTQYGSGTPCSKINACSNGVWQQTSLSSTTELTNIFNSSGIFISIDNLLVNGSLSKELLFSPVLAKDGKPIGEKLFQSFGVNPSNYFKSNIKSYDLFLVWEPLGVIRHNGGLYVGTAHELLTYAHDEVKGTYGSGSYDAYTYVSNSLTQQMGCAVNLEDSDAFGKSVSQKFNSFSARSYFNGRLDASTAGAVSSLCNSDAKGGSFKTYVLNSQNGFTSPFAIGILWFDEAGGGNGVSCYTIQNEVGNGNASNGHSIIKNSIEKFGTFDFSQYNNKYKAQGLEFPMGAETGLTAKWYSDYCDSPTIEIEYNGIDCTPTYNIPSCTSGDNKTLVYKDSTDWEHCIFTDENEGYKNKYNINPHKWSDKTENLSYYDENLSSPYCDVYCIEEVYGNFDSNNPTVLAGNHFIWGWSTVQTIRTCKTKSINIGSKDIVGSFLYDLNKANEAIVEELAKNKLASVNSDGTWSTSGPKTGTCNSYSVDGVVNDGQSSCTGKTGIQHPGSCSSWNVDGKKHQNCTYTYTSSCSDYTYSKKDTSESVTVGSITKSATVELSTFSKSCQTSAPSGNPVSGGDVDSAIKNLETVIANYKKCYEFANENVLTDNSVANISYRSPNSIYDYSGEMKATRSSSYDDASCTTTAPFEAFTTCSGSSCSVTSVNLYSCTSHTEVGKSITQFSLAGDVYQYVIKNPNGLTLKSVDTSAFNANYKDKTSLNYQSKTIYTYNWTDVGYSNFPVPFKAGGESYTGSLEINYANVGHTSDNEIDVHTILNSVPRYGDYAYGNWSCGYKVKANLIECEDPPCVGDINVIYREIDLYNPFPDTNSRGRHTGANWCSLENCDYDKDNAVVNSYILQNRNVTGDDIYYLEPMYTFIMTPSDIIKIRKYNDKNTYSSYEGTLDGKKYAFTCTRGSLRNCRSDYLSQLLTDLDAVNLTGSCKGDRQVYQGSTARSQFESCRYKGK